MRPIHGRAAHTNPCLCNSHGPTRPLAITTSDKKTNTPRCTFLLLASPSGCTMKVVQSFMSFSTVWPVASVCDREFSRTSWPILFISTVDLAKRLRHPQLPYVNLPFPPTLTPSTPQDCACQILDLVFLLVNIKRPTSIRPPAPALIGLTTRLNDQMWTPCLTRWTVRVPRSFLFFKFRCVVLHQPRRKNYRCHYWIEICQTLPVVPPLYRRSFRLPSGISTTIL